MSEWKEVTLSDVTSVLGDGIHGTPKYSDNGDYYFINGNNLCEGKIVFKSDTKRVSEDEYIKYRKELTDRTLLFSINGTVGNVAKYNGEPCILGKSACYFNIIDSVDKDYIYYVVSSPSFVKSMSNLANGTTIKNVSLKQMREKKIYLPPLEIQQSIASILSSLDDKIAVNKKICENLEAQAQALFKYWFIDFAPFKDGNFCANREQNETCFNSAEVQPKITGKACKFVESELGLIPEGWRVGKLSELIDVKYGKDHKKLLDGNIPVYGSGGLMRKVDRSLYEGESVLIPRKGTLNNVMYVNEAFWTVDTMFYSIPKLPNIALYVYILLSKKDLASMNAGSAVPSMTTDILNNMQIIIPNEDVLEHFNLLVSAYYAQIKHNEQESLRLATLRDTLLPKLMSGQIKVNEIERAYE